jgi:hypothetical protein
MCASIHPSPGDAETLRAARRMIGIRRESGTGQMSRQASRRCARDMPRASSPSVAVLSFYGHRVGRVVLAYR